MDVATTSAPPDEAVGPPQLNVDRTGIVLRPNNSRVVIRPFQPADDHRVERIIGRVCALSEAQVEAQLDDVMQEFRDRHQKIRQFFLERFEAVRRLMLTDQPISEARRLLIGAYFTQEYALESAALFNPSMVWDPDQSGLPEGSRRFILSLRATGEGHISSITFRTGVVDADDVALLLQVEQDRYDGTPAQQRIAAAWGVNERTVRRRRARTLAALRTARGDYLAACA